MTINVAAVNDSPVAADDTYATNEDTPLVVVAPGVLGNDNDVEEAAEAAGEAAQEQVNRLIDN